MLNKVTLIGRLGRDPETRYTSSGCAVTTFSLATDEHWTDSQTGNKMKKTEWHRIVAWRHLAEICSKHLSKGKQVFVEGRLQTRSWEQDGITRYTTEIIMSKVIMLGKRSDVEYQTPQNNIPVVPPVTCVDDAFPF